MLRKWRLSSSGI
nr:unnamed protein product [Callosobruchus chinensis]CAH7738535.1 unnamed protein product [Callosobruchus chinensis]CAH7739197.1 unnamed protein product [Callosobruchus chinensis]CAH7739966.1 unnamed protein product [Callosobruchus chinensis]CAH7740023.1 unnamed protein product [Callosobruchus chinensis]